MQVHVTLLLPLVIFTCLFFQTGVNPEQLQAARKALKNYRTPLKWCPQVSLHCHKHT